MDEIISWVRRILSRISLFHEATLFHGDNARSVDANLLATILERILLKKLQRLMGVKVGELNGLVPLWDEDEKGVGDRLGE